MSLDSFTQALDQVEPYELPQAAQAVVQRLDDYQLLQHRQYCSEQEPNRRAREAAKEEGKQEGVAEVIQEMWEAHPEWKPAYGDSPETAKPWRQPQGGHDSYPPEAWVTQDGKKWRNALPIFNGHKPGDLGAGWEEYYVPPAEAATEDGTREHPFTWRAGLSLKKGQHITYDGQIYVLQQDHTSADHWRPGSPGLESIYKPA